MPIIYGLIFLAVSYFVIRVFENASKKQQEEQRQEKQRVCPHTVWHLKDVWCVGFFMEFKLNHELVTMTCPACGAEKQDTAGNLKLALRLQELGDDTIVSKIKSLKNDLEMDCIPNKLHRKKLNEIIDSIGGQENLYS
jgi:rubredoxin